MASTTRGALTFPPAQSSQIDPYTPSAPRPNPSYTRYTRPYVTLTFATSLDSNLAASPGTQTVLSGPESKAMTHYLRSKHDAILIGVGTAIADNPSLNCRIEGVGGYGGEGLDGQPRPVILDTNGRWRFDFDTKVIQLAREGKGKAPWIFTGKRPREEAKKLLESVGGEYIVVDADDDGRGISWQEVFYLLTRKGIKSVMIEGGGTVINRLLSSHFEVLDSVIVTIAPTWLGRGGVQVCPKKSSGLPVPRLKNVKWIPLGEDVVLCGHPKVLTWEDTELSG